MTNSDFLALPKDVLLTGAKHAYKNARELADCATVNVRRHSFGPGNSLLILAGEECIKSIVLLAEAFNVETSVRIDRIFRYHGTKHQIAAEIQPSIRKLGVFAESLQLIFSGKTTSRDKVFQLGLSIAVDFVLAGNSPVSDLAFSEFWTNANDRKNTGLYVDYLNGAWSTPQQVSKDEYYITLNHVNTFLELIKVVDLITVKDCFELDAKKIHNGVPIQGPFTLLDPTNYEVLE